MNTNFIPAKLKLVCTLCVLAVIFAFSLTFSVSADISSVERVDENDYIVADNEDFVFEFSTTEHADRFSFVGLVYKKEEVVLKVNNYLCLYNHSTEEYFKVPTKMALDYDIEHEVENGSRFARGGIEAFVLKSQLDDAHENYEICFLYRNNENNNIIYTGVFLS